jgi:hypothetical protein
MGADRLWEMTLEQNGHLDAVEFILSVQGFES